MSGPDSHATAAGEAGEKASPVKKPGMFRRSAFIICAVVILAFVVILPWWLDRRVLGAITSALHDRGLELTPESRLSVSVFGLSLHGEPLRVRQIDKPDEAPVFVSQRLYAKLALLDSMSSRDLIIDEVTLEGVSGDLRRRKDGRSPLEVPEEGKPAAPGQDWVSMARKVADWWKQRQAEEEKKHEEPKPGEPTPPPQPKPSKPTDRWNGQAVRYEPAQQPLSQGHWPRILVRRLLVTGTTIGLPDQSVLDVTTFEMKGSMITSRLLPDEVMSCDGSVTTSGAGPMTLALQRQGGRSGNLRIAAPQLPIEALADAKVSGDSLAQYHPKGMADLNIVTTWTGVDLQGEVTSRIQNLNVQPDKESGDRARQVAEIVNHLKGQTVVWPMKLGGTVYAPIITDSGVEAVLKDSAMDAVKNAAQERAQQEADKAQNKAIDKVNEKIGDKLDSQPAAKDAVDKAKGFFKGLGK